MYCTSEELKRLMVLILRIVTGRFRNRPASLGFISVSLFTLIFTDFLLGSFNKDEDQKKRATPN